MRQLCEQAKVDVALTSQSLNGPGTGSYYKLSDYRRALFVVEVGGMAVATTSVLQVMQATDAAGSGAKVVGDATCTITANTRVAAATLTAAACAPGDTFAVNGITFTGAAAADLANRKFLADAAKDGDTAASIAAAINHSTSGVPGVTAAADNGVVTITATEPGEATITVAGTAVRLVAATLRAVGYVEVEASYLDLANGFDYIALQVTNSAATQTGAVVLRGDARYRPISQKVAASYATAVA
jgi:hypothetical protein